jgi:hypothetical protein
VDEVWREWTKKDQMACSSYDALLYTPLLASPRMGEHKVHSYAQSFDA